MRLKDMIEMAASVVVVAGIPLFFIQQHIQDNNARVDKSLQYFLLFQSETYMKPRTDIFYPWLHYDIANFMHAAPPAAVVQKFVKDVVSSNPDVVASLNRVDTFYKGVALCTENRLCDAATAHRLFGPFAREVYCLYMPAFDEIQLNLAMRDFGKPLETFATLEGGCE